MNENVGSTIGFTTAMSRPYMALMGSQYDLADPPSGSTPSASFAARMDSTSTTFRRSRTYGSTKSSSCVVDARIAADQGTRLTSAFLPRSSALARSSTQRVTSVSAGPPLGGLYLNPPSSAGCCDGVIQMP